MDTVILGPKKQGFNGLRYYLGGRYYKRREPCPTNRCGWKTALLHRRVWEYHHGEIPPGFEVHHKDEDPANNQVGNLELKTIAAHKLVHVTDADRARLARLQPLGIEAAKAWHGSDDGRRWHSKHGRQAMKARRAAVGVITFTCAECGKRARTRDVCHKPIRYCSARCNNRVQGRRKRARACGV